MRLISILILIFFIHQATCQTPVFRNFTVKDGLSSNVAYDIIQDSKDFLWIATENGVCRFDGKDFKTFTIKEGLADNEVFKIREDTKGRIWFLSYNGKLSFFQNGLIFNENNLPILKHLGLNILQGNYLRIKKETFGFLLRKKALNVSKMIIQYCTFIPLRDYMTSSLQFTKQKTRSLPNLQSSNLPLETLSQQK